MRWIKFILSHSIFIALCASGLSYQTFVLMKLPFDISVLGLIFFATLAAYNSYWIFCKWSSDRKKNTSISFSSYASYFILLIASSIVLIDYLWFNPDFISYIFIAVVLTLFYSLPFVPNTKIANFKNAGFVKTFLLAITWSFVTVIIPAHEMLNNHLQEIIILFLIRFLFMLMLCIIFDSRDVKVDLLHNLQSLATDVNSKVLSIIMVVILIIYTMLLFWLQPILSNQRHLFVLMSTGFLTFIIYILSLKKRGYYFYYFLVDGIMLLSSFATYMATI